MPDKGSQLRAPWMRDKPGLRLQLMRAGLVGLVAGVVAVAFLLLVQLTEKLRYQGLEWAHSHVWAAVALVLACAALAALAGYLTSTFAPEAAGSGIPQVKAVMQYFRVMRYKRVVPVKFIAGVLALASGMSLGREGPTVQIGAAIGQGISLLLKLPRRIHNQLIAAGAGAGLAAAFNAPLAGFIFTLEEIRFDLSSLNYGIMLIAAVVADITVRSMLGQEPAFLVQHIATPPIEYIPLFFILGALACGAGLAFHKLLMWLQRLMQEKVRIPRWAKAAVVAGGMAAVALVLPYSWGGGYTVADYLLSGTATTGIGMLLLLLVLRILFTALSYSTGVPGGIFAPMLAMGAIVGVLLGKFSALVIPGMQDAPTGLGIVGMAAVFAAVVRAPLTGVVLVVEMTGNYDLLLPLMAASMTAYLIASRFNSPPIYDALLGLELSGGQTTHGNAENVVWLELTVEQDSRASHARIAELGWPEGCLAVTVTRGLHHIVPTGKTRVRPGDQLRIVVETENNVKAAEEVRASLAAGD